MAEANEIIIESTLKRHGYYCRSRKNLHQGKRLRACIPCARAKARCDNIPGACTRCATKKLQCEYRSHHACVADGRDKSSDVDAHAAIHTLLPGHTDTSLPEVDDVLTNFDIEHFDWNIIDASTSELQASYSQYFPPNSGPNGLHGSNIAVTEFSHEALRLTDLDAMFTPSILPIAMRCFTGKSAFQGRTKVTATMMKRILTAYPAMMRTRDSLPPFIHPSSYSCATAILYQPSESLATCESLMQLHGSSKGGDASRRLVWKNVRLECERLHLEVWQCSFQIMRS
jgi:hypothetical protein